MRLPPTVPMPASGPLTARRGDQRGQVLVLFTLVLVVLLLVSALAVDYGAWLVSRRSYQNVADAAALAGAQQLSRPLMTACPSGATKNVCARQAAWASVKQALGLTALDAMSLGSSATSSSPYVENGYRVWVASPPADANAGCSSNCPYPGHVSGPGTVFVRVEHPGQHFLSRIAFPTDSDVVAWATAGRLPANFAVIGMCDPNTGATCLANNSNIKIDGTNSLLAVVTGDLGTNAWTKTSGSSSAIGLGPDSNAYMGLFEDCWNAGGNQCNLYTYTPPVDYSSPRSAAPLGAAIVDPAYPAPTVDNTATPMQCWPGYSGTVTLASLTTTPGNAAPVVQTAAQDPPLDLAAAVAPATPRPATLAAGLGISGIVTAAVGGATLGGITITVVSGINSYSTTTAASGANKGKYSINNVAAGTYTVTATDTTGAYRTTSISVTPTTSTANLSMPHNPIITGTIRDANTSSPLSGAAIVVNGPTGPFPTTTNTSGVYTVTVGASGTYTVAASLNGYVNNSVSSGPVAYDATAVVNLNLTPAPASVTGTITDAATALPLPGVTVTLSSGGSATTNASGVYTIGAAVQGSQSYTLSGSALTGYVPGSSTPGLSSSWQYTGTVVAGANTQNFQLWPMGCKSGQQGNWSCAYPSGNNCPTTTNVNGSNVTCAFTQANAIRPGTYNNITINGCAWIDPKGGATGLATGQSPGMVHLTGTLSMANNSYLFGDGVTIVMDTTASINVGNGGGFVLNFGSQYNTTTSTCDFSTIKEYKDGTIPCFRTVTPQDNQDYAYAAWTSKGHNPWECSGSASNPPVYSTSCVQVGQELGVTFYLYGTPTSSGHRFNISTANMGYLFNGVLYGPRDDIALGGGKDGQTAAGQIVGWTIEYHGGTQIIQRWYADPIDGPPFLIEPILGECVAPIVAC